MIALERLFNSQPLPPLFFCLFSPPPFHPFLFSPFSHPFSPSLHFLPSFIFSSLFLTFSLLPHIFLSCVFQFQGVHSVAPAMAGEPASTVGRSGPVHSSSVCLHHRHTCLSCSQHVSHSTRATFAHSARYGTVLNVNCCLVCYSQTT